VENNGQMKKLFLFEHFNPGRKVKIKGHLKNLVGCGIYYNFRCGPVTYVCRRL
jgi:hypothetical protein